MPNICLPECKEKRVKRPLIPYFGGKWRIAPWVISHFPPHRCYTEVFGGAASCLLRKERVPCEVYNDLNDEIVNLFRVLRDKETASDLIELVCRTPYARTEYFDSYIPCNSQVEQARKTIFRFHSAFACDCQVPGRQTGFKTDTEGKDANGWRRFPEALRAIIDRLQGVLIENRDAQDILAKFDDPQTLHFVDPPYLAATRTSKRVYQHELTDDQHKRLAETLQSLCGMVILAGYPSELYDRLYPGWQQFTQANKTCGNSIRTEAIWLNPAATAALEAHHARSVPDI